MDRSTFIERAPNYYALAIAIYFVSRDETASERMVRRYYAVSGALQPFGDEEPVSYLDNEILFERAVQILVERGFVREVPDDFGPTIYEKAEGFDEAWELAEQDESLPFAKYRLVKSDKEWLHSALNNINVEYADLGLKDSDFESPSHEWEPLPLNRAETSLQEATSQLDETISQIQADNGYAVTLPGERDLVVDSLSSAAERLKRDPTISWGYLQRNVFTPLKVVLRRFGGAGLGAVVRVTITIFQKWIEGLGIEWLNALWKAFWSSM